MDWLPWLIIGFVGIGLLVLFYYFVCRRKQGFDSPLLGLLTLSVLLISLSILQPPRFKYGDLEVNIRKIQHATDEAEQAGKLASEAAAIMFWNGGRFDGTDTEKAKQIMKSIYGPEKGKELVEYYIDQGIFKTSEEEKNVELKGKSNIAPPKGIDSPYLETFMKTNK
jgi:hypothetical protein